MNRLNVTKERFKEAVFENIKTQFRKTIDQVNEEQVFHAVAYAVRDIIVDQWIETHKTYEEKDAKTVYYLSMEFLMGRALGNNMINLLVNDVVREVLDELGFDLNVIEDQEPDAGLGTVVLEDLRHVSWIHWQHWNILHTDVVSAIDTVFLSRRS